MSDALMLLIGYMSGAIVAFVSILVAKNIFSNNKEGEKDENRN
jgi:hypothetical protein